MKINFKSWKQLLKQKAISCIFLDRDFLNMGYWQQEANKQNTVFHYNQGHAKLLSTSIQSKSKGLSLQSENWQFQLTIIWINIFFQKLICSEAKFISVELKNVNALSFSWWQKM